MNCRALTMKISTIILHVVDIISIAIQMMRIFTTKKQKHLSSLRVKVLFIVLTIDVWVGIYFGLVADA